MTSTYKTLLNNAIYLSFMIALQFDAGWRTRIWIFQRLRMVNICATYNEIITLQSIIFIKIYSSAKIKTLQIPTNLTIYPHFADYLLAPTNWTLEYSKFPSKPNNCPRIKANRLVGQFCVGHFYKIQRMSTRVLTLNWVLSFPLYYLIWAHDGLK